MKSIEQRLPKDFDKSFIVFQEIGNFFPCPWHYHPEYELVLVKKSTGRRMVGDHIGYFNEGDLVLMGPLLPHVWVNDEPFLNGEAGYMAEAIVIQFVESFVGETFFQIPEMESFKNFLKLSNLGMVITGTAKKKIIKLMDKMVHMSGLQRLAALLKIFDILSHTSEYELLASPRFVENIQFKSSDQFRKINEYIMRNFQEEIKLPEIAGLANMALTTFCNFFKEHYRVTFIEYLNSVRIGHACKLLSEKELNVVEVAFECGFNNLANFNKQFKKFKKMTPTEYRKTVRM